MSRPRRGARALNRLVTAGIRAYKLVISPWLPHACRFQPTCSEYAIAVLERDGLRRGGRRALARLSRCHPWSGSGGLDLP